LDGGVAVDKKVARDYFWSRVLLDSDYSDKLDAKWVSKANSDNQRTGSMHEKKAILVVDDLVEILNSVNAILSEQYSVSLAKSPSQASKVLEKKHIDLMLLDQGMAELSGLEFLQQIRKNPQLASLPVIFLTANATGELIAVASQYGISGFLVKPVDPDKLLQKIEEVLAQSDPV
jgi:CheY-like chemotaxis protein